MQSSCLSAPSSGPSSYYFCKKSDIQWRVRHGDKVGRQSSDPRPLPPLECRRGKGRGLLARPAQVQRPQHVPETVWAEISLRLITTSVSSFLLSGVGSIWQIMASITRMVRKLRSEKRKETELPRCWGLVAAANPGLGLSCPLSLCWSVRTSPMKPQPQSPAPAPHTAL